MITRLFTTNPPREEEFRSDITWTPTAGENLNYGSGKGLELIPTEHTEIILGVLPYLGPRCWTKRRRQHPHHAKVPTIRGK